MQSVGNYVEGKLIAGEKRVSHDPNHEQIKLEKEKHTQKAIGKFASPVSLERNTSDKRLDVVVYGKL
jgi:hypothetical protein